jgi:hypothetical protein
MTTQHQIIAFCVLASIAVPLGTFVTIKTINKLMRPPINRLVRTHGDIELNYIQPGQTYNYPDLLEPPAPIYDRIQSYSYPPSYETGVIPSYRSGTLPHYQSVDGININCCLEDNINLDYIFYIILFLIILLYIRKLIISNQLNNQNMIILLILLLTIIYIQFGLLVLTQIIILFIIITLSNFLLGLNPYSNWLHIIKITSIIVIIFIIYYNSLYSISILIPFSTFDIDFRDSFEWKISSYKVKPDISYLKLQTLTKDINSLLLSLVDDENYSMSLSFILSYKKWKDNKEKIEPFLIDDAIIINKESDPILITQFILKRLDDKNLFITNWFFKDTLINTMDPVILTVTMPIMVKI